LEGRRGVVTNSLAEKLTFVLQNGKRICTNWPSSVSMKTGVRFMVGGGVFDTTQAPFHALVEDDLQLHPEHPQIWEDSFGFA
jgi:hypothetical protein